MGYARARSTVSLVSGLVCGVALIVSGWFLLQESLLAAYVTVVLALLLAGFFGFRFFRTGKWMPAGVMAILSLGALIFLIPLIF